MKTTDGWLVDMVLSLVMMRSSICNNVLWPPIKHFCVKRQLGLVLLDPGIVKNSIWLCFRPAVLVTVFQYDKNCYMIILFLPFIWLFSFWRQNRSLTSVAHIDHQHVFYVNKDLYGSSYCSNYSDIEGQHGLWYRRSSLMPSCGLHSVEAWPDCQKCLIWFQS